MRKYMLLLGLSLCFFSGYAEDAFAGQGETVLGAKQVNVVIDGKPVEYTVESGIPFIDAVDRVQVPLRASMDAFDASVAWNQEERVASVSKDGVEIEVPVGEPYIFVNGTVVKNDTSAQLLDGRIYLPIASVFKSFGAKVSWDDKNSDVVVKSNPNGGFIIYNNTTYKMEKNGIVSTIKAKGGKTAYIVSKKNSYMEMSCLSQLLEEPITYKAHFFGLSQKKGTIIYKSKKETFKWAVDRNRVLDENYVIYQDRIYLPVNIVLKNVGVKHQLVYDINKNQLSVRIN